MDMANLSPRSHRRIQRALIVGGGIAGPVAGMWLRRLGVEVVVAEAREGPALAEGAFLGVAPNGMNVLDQLGVAGPVAAQGYGCEAFRFLNRRGERIGFIDRSADRERFGWPLTMIRRSALHEVLTEEALRCGVRFEFGKRLIQLERSSPREVIACFEDGTEERGDIVLGCDGLNSRVRRIVMPDAPEPSALGLLDCGGFAQRQNLPIRTGYNEMVFGRRAFFGAFATGTDEVWWFHNGPVSGDTLDAGALRERLLELHREDPPWVGELVAATPHVLGPWSLQEMASLPRWFDGRVCLLGDAAHAMSPSAGQGASMAMEDALVLTRCLRDIEDPSEAFRAFEQHRRPRVEAISRLARRSGSGKAIESRVSEWFRDRLLPLFLRLGAPAQSKSYGYRLNWNAGHSSLHSPS